MAIVKIAQRQTNYLVLQKVCLEERHLSWGAKGLHSYLMSKPSNWEININHLVKESRQGKTAVYSLINELIEAGFIKRKEKRDPNSNRFQGVSYIVYELPEFIESEGAASRFSGYGKPGSGNPYPENQSLINIDINKQGNNKQAAKQIMNKADPSASFSSLSKKINSEIEGKLNLEQIEYLTQCLLSRFKQLTLQESFKTMDFENLSVAVQHELENPNSYKKAKQNFQHKLNIILSEAEKGRWHPQEILQRQANEMKVEQQRHRARLEGELKPLLMARAGFVSDLVHLRHVKPDDSALLQSYEASITKLDNQIKPLMAQLKTEQTASSMQPSGTQPHQPTGESS